LDAISVANALVEQEVKHNIAEHTVERSLLNVISVANVLVKREI